MNIETEHALHARHLVSELTLQELDSFDGIVAVSHTPLYIFILLHCIRDYLWHITCPALLVIARRL